VTASYRARPRDPTARAMSQEKVCVLISGGLDSSVLACELAQNYGEVHPVFVRNGLVWESAELFWLARFLNAVHQPNIHPLKQLHFPMEDVYGRHWSTTGDQVPDARAPLDANYLPGRNLILLAKAAVYCALHRIPVIALGVLRSNPFPDSTPGFFRHCEQLLGQGLNSSLRIITPYAQLTKSDVVRRGRSWPLGLTFSCLAPVNRRHCGRCTKCAERREAFRRAGLPDPTDYAG